MKTQIKHAVMLPAVDGWRAVLTDTNEAYLLDVVAWMVDARHVEDNEDGEQAEWLDARGTPLVVDDQGKGLCMPQDLTYVIPGDWHYYGLLAPGEELGKSEPRAGWSRVPWPAGLELGEVEVDP